MGWKADAVLIRPATLEIPASRLLTELGCENLSTLGEMAYDQVIWPNQGTIWVGAIRDCVIISARGVAERFIEALPSAFADTLLRRFPQSEVAAVTLHSVVNLWGFALYRGGRPIRRKAGSADQGTFEDFGNSIPEEQDLLSKSALDAKSRRIYRLPEFPNEDLSEDQVGEEYVFKVYERLTGERPDIGDNLLETRCVGFRFAWPDKPRPRENFWGPF